jgi:phage shock protein PspC (stress-responsive transcriptional regulator)
MIGGVCGGLADYLNMDPTLVRILTVVIALFTGIPVVLYIVALFVVPEEPTGFPPQGYPPVQAPQGYDNPYAAPAPGAPFGDAGYGQPPAQREAEVWGTAGAPWEQPAANMSPGPAPSPEPAPWPEPAPTPPAEPAQPTESAPPTQAAAPAEPEPAAPPQPDPVTPAHEADAEESFDEPDHPVASSEDQPKS